MTESRDVEPAAAQAVRAFWFGPLQAGLAEPARRRRWFAGGAAFDDEIRDRFAHLIDAAASGALDGWQGDAAGSLAFVLVCDQFSRQVHRGDARAFATDALALAAARSAVERGFDRELGWDERAFVYLPFEHSESRIDQHTAVGLYLQLRDEAPDTAQAAMNEYLRYALQHRDIIDRFGRFPHRNAVLQRTSTRDERDYLRAAPTFGQTRRD